MSLSGSGRQATDFFNLSAGLAFFGMSHTGSSNFAVWLLDSAGNRVDLLANEIGSWNGDAAISIPSAGPHLLDITADGSWRVDVTQRLPQAVPAPHSFDGQGRSYALVSLRSGLARFAMTHGGASNFAIWLMDSRGQIVDLLVNDIGAFSGSAAVQVPSSGPYVVDITADGPWSVEVSQ